MTGDRRRNTEHGIRNTLLADLVHACYNLAVEFSLLQVKE